MNKKGVSQVITTILIILLVLAAIIIVWQAVKSTIESSTGGISGSVACMNTQLEFVAGSVSCTDADASTLDGVNLNFTVSRGADNVVYDGIKVVIEGTVNDDTAPGELGSKKYSYSSTDSNGVVANQEDIVVKIAPVITDDNGDAVTCDPTDEILVDCPADAGS